jgi:hypothetical protein
MKPEEPALYHDVENNTLLNDVFFYVLHHLPQLQNMHEYMVPAQADTDPRVMEAFVQRKYPQLPGPPHVPSVQIFSRNLLAYLETLVLFSPYYRADDGRMAGKMETFYHQAIDRHKDFQDRQLYQYITRKLTAWCKLYHPKQPSVESADNEDIDGDEGDIVNVPAGEAVHSQSFTMSGDEEEEESAAPAAAAAAARAAAAESGGDGAGLPAAGGAVDV